MEEEEEEKEEVDMNVHVSNDDEEGGGLWQNLKVEEGQGGVGKALKDQSIDQIQRPKDLKIYSKCGGG